MSAINTPFQVAAFNLMMKKGMAGHVVNEIILAVHSINGCTTEIVEQLIENLKIDLENHRQIATRKSIVRAEKILAMMEELKPHLNSIAEIVAKYQ